LGFPSPPRFSRSRLQENHRLLLPCFRLGRGSYARPCNTRRRHLGDQKKKPSATTLINTLLPIRPPPKSRDNHHSAGPRVLQRASDSRANSGLTQRGPNIFQGEAFSRTALLLRAPVAGAGLTTRNSGFAKQTFLYVWACRARNPRRAGFMGRFNGAHRPARSCLERNGKVPAACARSDCQNLEKPSSSLLRK